MRDYVIPAMVCGLVLLYGLGVILAAGISQMLAADKRVKWRSALFWPAITILIIFDELRGVNR